jgi:hypothetical protein
MSGGKFAAITASLLARKGEAHPSSVPEFSKTPILWSSSGRHVERRAEWPAEMPEHREPPRPEPIRREPPVREVPRAEQLSSQIPRFSEFDAGAPDHPFHGSGEKKHRLSLALTSVEHEKLGIVAVKKGLTRHQLMREALDCYFDKLASEYKSNCACIATGGCQNACGER